jgi:N-acylneuraminate cytidylyltransferase
MFDGRRVLAVVPARGGSKSIPRKNVRLLAGHPLLAWSVAAGVQAQTVDRVLVSTDDPEIRAVALRCGADAPFLRPAALAADDTPDFPVFEHAVAWLEREQDWHADIVVQLRPTSPLRPPGLVDAGVALLACDPGCDSLRAVSAPSQTPYKMWRQEPGTPYLRPLLGDGGPEAYNRPRQELPPALWQTGHLDVFWTETMRAKRSLTGDRILPITLPGRYSLDIDTLEQWDFAEWLLRRGGMPMVRPGLRPCPVNEANEVPS